MWKYFLILLALVCYENQLKAQNFDDYQLLEPKGEIPKVFFKQLAPSDKKKSISSSDFWVKNLLLSGKVLFKDTLSQYLNQIAQQLLKEDRVLQKKIKCYVLRSEEVTAFAAKDGSIFISMGLIAQLASEAQLAFALAEQIAHVKKRHTLLLKENYTNLNNNIRASEMIKHYALDYSLAKIFYYEAKDMIEATKIASKIYLTSPYQKYTISNFFEVLEFSYLPFDLDAFDYSFLETENLKLNTNYYLPSNESNKIGLQEKKTTPYLSNLAERKLAVNVIETLTQTDTKENQLLFEKKRDLARFDLCYYYLHKFDYQNALYAAFLLSKKYPNSRYLEKIKVKALYGFAKFKNQMKGLYVYYTSSYPDNDIYLHNMRNNAYEKVEGELQKVYYTLTSMTHSELTVLAARHIWNMTNQYPDDIELKRLKADIMIDLVYHFPNYKYFVVQDSSSTKVGSSKKLSKYDKIKQSNTQEIKQQQVHKYSFIENAFRDIAESKHFQYAFTVAEASKEAINNRVKEERIDEKRLHPKPLTADMGLDSILIVEPYYNKIINKKIEKKKFSSTTVYNIIEQKQAALSSYLTNSAEIAKVNAVLFSKSEIEKNNIQYFKDNYTLKEWVSQQARFGNAVSMRGFNENAIADIQRRYGVRYVLFSGIISLQKGETFWVFQSLLFDLETGDITHIKNDFYEQKDTPPMVKSHVFDVLFQIKTPSKKKK